MLLYRLNFSAVTAWIQSSNTALTAWLHRGELHAYLAGGRFGNKVFQQAAISLLAEKYNLRASYQLVEEFAEMGIPLFHGENLMRGDDVELTDDLLYTLLTSAERGPLPGRLIVSGYYQTPWFSYHLREVFREKYAASLHRANPWRSRVGANSDTFVHVRLGDLADRGPRPASDYIRAIGTPAGRVFIASDSLTHDIVRTLASHFSATLLDDLSLVRTIQFGSTCAFIVLSDGTLSWTIGAMAGSASRVRIVPRDFEWHGNITQADWQRY